MVRQSQTPADLRVFVCGPISEALEPTGFNADLQSFILTLLESLMVAGLNVASAHVVEDFGNNIPQNPHKVFERDYSLIHDSDAVIVLLPERPDGQIWRSDGSFIEIGWATAMGKPTILVTNLDNAKHSYLLRGLAGSKNILGVIPISSPREIASRAASLLRNAFSTHAAPPRGATLGFCCTSFGFGPVSKLGAIAGACRARDPHCKLRFVGSNVAKNFAQSACLFDEIVDIDTDQHPGLAIQELLSCDVVVNCLNFEMLRMWPIRMPPMVFVDSLAWIWPESMEELIRAEAYLVQDFLLNSPGSSESWSSLPNVMVVPPIVSSTSVSTDRSRRKVQPGRVLVNIAGCRNPILDKNYYSTYADAVISSLAAIARQGGDLLADSDLKTVVISGNAEVLPGPNTIHWPEHVSCKMQFLEHSEFIQELSICEIFLTSPGLTATLEAVALGVPLRFLPPQNYSQFLILKKYQESGLNVGRWLTSIGSSCLANGPISEEKAVRFIASELDQYFARPHKALMHDLEEALKAMVPASALADLRSQTSGWDGSSAVTDILSSILDRRR